MLSAIDMDFLQKACALAFLSPSHDRAYAVGAILTDASGAVLGEGYSRMDGGSCHAEEIIFQKLAGSDLSGGTLYSSLQPCGRRLSGVKSCQDYIVGAGLAKVIYAVREPNYFLQHGGDEILQAAGIEVIFANVFLDEVKRANSFVNDWSCGQL